MDATLKKFPPYDAAFQNLNILPWWEGNWNFTFFLANVALSQLFFQQLMLIFLLICFYVVILNRTIPLEYPMQSVTFNFHSALFWVFPRQTIVYLPHPLLLYMYANQIPMNHIITAYLNLPTRASLVEILLSYHCLTGKYIFIVCIHPYLFMLSFVRW
jgi:hypothetical protein